MPRKITLPGPDDPEIVGVPASSSKGSGRVRHEEKITVYISRAELLRLEQARLAFRADHGLAVDRGRIVREAIAAALDDFDARWVPVVVESGFTR